MTVPGPLRIRDALVTLDLRILATTDLHMNLGTAALALPGEPGERAPCGLAAAAGLARKLRDRVPNSLLLDNGDFLQGTWLAEDAMRNASPDTPHPVIAAMNAVGYDAVNLGNHDFDYGIEPLRAAISHARFPVLNANILRARRPGPEMRGGEGWFAPTALLRRNLTDRAGNPWRVTIGLIGLAPPQTTVWAHQVLRPDAVALDIVEAARARLADLRGAGADLVIALAHSGIGEATHTPGMENAAIPLAGLDGIDVLILGHSHAVFPSPAFAGRKGVDTRAGTIMGKPAVMAGAGGSHLGVIDLVLERRDIAAPREETLGWKIAAASARALRVRDDAGGGGDGGDRGSSGDGGDGASPLAGVPRATARFCSAARKRAAAIVARSDVALHTYFTQIGHDPAGNLVASAQRAHMSERLRAPELASLPVLSASAPFRAGGIHGPAHYIDLPAGMLRLRDLSALYPHSNRVTALAVSGAQIRDWLERAAGMFRQITPGAGAQALLDPASAAHNFDTIHGLSYEIDLRAPARYGPKGQMIDPRAQRIRGLCHDGRPVRDDARFILVTNGFRAFGGGRFPGTGAANVIAESPASVTDALRDFLAAGGRAENAQAWRFASLPDTEVVFQTGPGARAFASTISALGLRDLGNSADGFARFAMSL